MSRKNKGFVGWIGNGLGRLMGSGGTRRSKKYHPKVYEVLDILRLHPRIDDSRIEQALGLSHDMASPFIARARQVFLQEQLTTPPQQPITTPSPSTGGTSVPHIQNNQGDINLVNYTPEELVQHVDRQVNRVQFGWSFNTTVMENFSEVWALVGPAILVIGTIGEVFLVLWLRQKVQDIIAGISIVAVALVMEGTFLAISYKAATIRNRGERRPDGPSELDRIKLKRQFRFWFALAAGVCATQIIFVAAQTNDAGIGVWGVWIFAILRAGFTLVADGYTAFAHEEKPTTAERDMEEQEQRTKHSAALLNQKRTEITIINDGILQVREAHTEAEIKDDKLRTRLQIEKMQNKTQVDTLRTQQEQATMFITLQNNMMRALFDPKMAEEDRQKLLGTMQGFMSAANLLPSPGQTTIIEEEDE